MHWPRAPFLWPKQVKAEITEIVTFLRNPRKFLAMGARSPAGILLVGPPGVVSALAATNTASWASEHTHLLMCRPLSRTAFHHTATIPPLQTASLSHAIDHAVTNTGKTLVVKAIVGESAWPSFPPAARIPCLGHETTTELNPMSHAGRHWQDAARKGDSGRVRGALLLRQRRRVHGDFRGRGRRARA